MDKTHRWTQLLADAGGQLATSLDVAVSLDAVAALAVTRVADWAAVHRKEGEEVTTIAVHHAEGKEELVWDALGRCRPAPHGYLQVIRTGEAELLADIDDET